MRTRTYCGLCARSDKAENDGLLAVDYPAFVPVLVEGINEQGRTLEALRNSLHESRAENGDCRTALKEHERRVDALVDRVLELEHRDSDADIKSTALRGVDGRWQSFSQAASARRTRYVHGDWKTSKVEEDLSCCGSLEPDPRIEKLELEVQFLEKGLQTLNVQVQELRRLLEGALALD